MNGNESVHSFYSNQKNRASYDSLSRISYDQYSIFAACSALLGLPSNILLLVILFRIGLFDKRQNVLSCLPFIKIRSTGSFERFLFEVVFIDTLLIIYHFVDNLLSYIHKDRSNGQHYLIHLSDFCCKFFTYIAKMSVLLTTWLLLFLILNQLTLTMEHNNHHRSCWSRGLYYVNAKYSTVFLIFIFSIYNIYPIEVLIYQKKEEQEDYGQGGRPDACLMSKEGVNVILLNATNYGYSLLGVAIPCIIIFGISITIVYRACRKNTNTNKECNSLYYIAATIGIVHALFNLPARITDLLLMFVNPYADTWFFPLLIKFNHESQSFISLSYGYKCFICILMSRRFRLHAKSVLCFLIESKYEDRHTIERLNSNDEWQQLTELKKLEKINHQGTESHSNKKKVIKSLSRKFQFSHINKDDVQRYKTSETTSWIRPYFTRNEKYHSLRPCGPSASCHEISAISSSLPSTIVEFPEIHSQKNLDRSSPHNLTQPSSFIVSVPLPNGESVYLPLPQKRASNYRSSPRIKHKIDPSSNLGTLKETLLPESVEEQSTNSINFLSSSHVY
ncbi:unnamed protein product [Rotaria magnacalcarata]|uniref:G-protein coupled receptors family 1 profile domain-containing protein n=1 Tax=Rotaria magnacalcarata TaxID=392030 RepID=A0A815E0N6_9BILA|nr:unnamed protein product [Rotaria magnacalcarata]CAF2152412.1 unnamed protein product [Rotaria magnacalcarata]CAF3857184.1 unnamed protein product [Rotaria magnacalcarata]CAF3861437.1 unnamed protein product [Rotaria magnacalcarata]